MAVPPAARPRQRTCRSSRRPRSRTQKRASARCLQPQAVRPFGRRLLMCVFLNGASLMEVTKRRDTARGQVIECPVKTMNIALESETGGNSRGRVCHRVPI